MAQLNNVATTVLVAGQQVHFVELTLTQKFNCHHICKIVVNYEEFDNKWMGNPVKLIKYIGESLIIEMSHTQTGETNIFNGILSNVTFEGSHGIHNNIVLHGMSETARLDGKPTMDSFVNKTLAEIVSEVVEAYGNGVEVNIAPHYKQSIDYMCMYNETAFDFLNRLSWMYGEAFFCNGSAIYFGSPQLDDSVPIMYDQEMTHFNLSVNLLPAKNQYYNYFVENDEEQIKATRNNEEATGYLKVALNKSEEFYSSDVIQPIHAGINDADTLLTLVDTEKARTLANMLVLSGTTQTCKIKVGKVVIVNFPASMEIDTTAGNFIITQVTHTIDQEGHYSNSFSGVRAALEQIPIPPMTMPAANSQRAIVVDNADPDNKGRVKVRFQWQHYLSKETNWIRVQTLDGGSSNLFKKNRGFVFIPEVGDEVMVNFENSNPSFPYVSGSLYSINKGEGGGENNHLKSIRTKNGHRIEFDDSDETLNLTIKDKNDNIIKLDTKNKTISIQSLEKIEIKSTQIYLEANDINLTSKTTTSTSDRLALFANNKVSIHADDTVDMESFNILNITGKESSVKGTRSVEVTGYEVNIGAEGKALVSGAATVVNGENSVIVKSPSISEVSQSQQYPFKEKIVKRKATMSIQKNK